MTTAEEMRIRESVAQASARFSSGYSLVALPNEFVPVVQEKLAPGGVRLDLVDDGEDDGMPAWIARPSSAVMEPDINDVKRRYRTFLVWFAVTAVAVVGLSIAGASDVAIYAFGFSMAQFAFKALGAHRVLERGRAAHAFLSSKGL